MPGVEASVHGPLGFVREAIVVVTCASRIVLGNA
jgi:hypothetical protein